jgi:hypothetical protein
MNLHTNGWVRVLAGRHAGLTGRLAAMCPTELLLETQLGRLEWIGIKDVEGF